MLLRQALFKFLLASAAVALAGCSAIDTNDKPSPDDAYIYGRFSVLITGSVFQLGAVGNASLFVRCDSGEEVYISFREDKKVQLRKLKPSKCALVEMVFANGIGVTLDRKPTRIAGVKLDLAPGGTYYVGDWELFLSRQVWRGKVRSYMEWKVVDHYAATTRLVKKAYPLFSSSATENLLHPAPADESVNCFSNGNKVLTYRSECD